MLATIFKWEWRLINSPRCCPRQDSEAVLKEPTYLVTRIHVCLLSNMHALKALSVWRCSTLLPRYRVPQSHRLLARPIENNYHPLRHFVDFALLFSRTRAVSSYLIVCSLTPTLSFPSYTPMVNQNILPSSLISSRSKFSAWHITLNLRVERQLLWKKVLYNLARNGARAWIQTTCASFKQHSMILQRLFRSYRKKLSVWDTIHLYA
jgi:hypothetical protein